MKKKFLALWILLLGIIVILSGCSSKGTAANGAEGKLRLNIADINTNPTFRVADAKGIFSKHGIDANIVNFGTPAEGVNALFIDQVDVAFGADFPLLNAAAKGDYAIIASSGLANDESASEWKLFVRDAIQSPEDLKGKKLSFMRGTFLPYLWDEYLKEHNVSLNDVELIGQGAFDEAFIALKQGDVDAAWFSGSAVVDKLQVLESVHQLTDMSQTKVRLGMGIITDRAFLEEHPEGIANFLKAIDEAAAYVAEHPEETADILYDKVKQPKEATLKDIPKNIWDVGFSQAAYDSLANQKKYMVDTGIIEQDFDLDSKLDLAALKQALPDKVTINK